MIIDIEAEGAKKRFEKKVKKALDKMRLRDYHKEVVCSGRRGHRKENRDIP